MAPAPNDDAGETPEGSAPPRSVVPLASSLDETPAAPTALPERPAPLSRVAIEQKLTAAGVNLRRGRAEEARRDISEVLAAQPRYAPAHEILGDIEAHLGRYAQACAAYKAALAIEPGRPTAELKLGRTALRATEAIGGFQTISESRPIARGNNALAGFLSAMLPGLGQIIQGAYAKGGVMIGVYVLANVLILFLPDTKEMLREVSGLLAPSHGAGGSAQASGMFWFLGFVAFADWLYSVIDAARTKD